MASGDAVFDPTQIAPDWDAQRKALGRMYSQGLINLNAKKNNTMAQYGFLNTPDFSQGGGNVDFSNLQVDPNQQYGAYRNELKSEADMMDAADNGPDRGFSGGLANQAGDYAKKAAAARQSGFMQNLQQTLGGFNQEAGNDQFQYNEGLNDVSTNATQYAGSEALWRATNPTGGQASVPGASGGGTTPIKPVAVTPLSASAINTAASYGYQTVANPTNLKPTGKGVSVPHIGLGY